MSGTFLSIGSYGRENNVSPSQQCPHYNLWDLNTLPHLFKMDSAPVVKVSLPNRKSILPYPGGYSVRARVLKSKEHFPAVVGGRLTSEKKAHRGVMSLALKKEGGATSQGMWEVSRIWKRQEIDSPPGLTDGRATLQTPGVHSVRPRLDF